MKMRVGFFALLLIISAAFSVCKKEDQISPSNAIISTIVIPGEWKITLFNELSIDKTSKFKWYSFKFNTNGTITAVNGSTKVNGAWSTVKEGEKTKIIIYFSEAPLNDLNDDWRIINHTSTTLELEHFPAENDGINFLTFQSRQ
jgi:hypothetical protein